MNEFLEDGWVESVRRLALGIELTDPLLRSRIGWPVEVSLDGPPKPRPSWQRSPPLSTWAGAMPASVLERHDSCRHVLLLNGAIDGPVAIRVQDRTQRFVPRRLGIEMPGPIGGGRRVHPALYPGATYPLAAGVVGLRGRIQRDGLPLRWARAEARRTTDDLVVGRAHGDEHGEFLLLLTSESSRGAALTLPFRARVTVFGPDVPPDPGADPVAAMDPLWDLPLEEVALGPAGDTVLAAEELPDGYVSRPGSTAEVEFSWHGLVREEFDFS